MLRLTYSHSRRTPGESRRLCGIVRGANASRLTFVRLHLISSSATGESPSIPSRGMPRNRARCQNASEFPTRDLSFFRFSRGEKEEGKVKLGGFSLSFESRGVGGSLEGAKRPEIKPSPTGPPIRRCGQKSCNEIVRLILSLAGFKAIEGLSRDKPRRGVGV